MHFFFPASGKKRGRLANILHIPVAIALWTSHQWQRLGWKQFSLRAVGLGILGSLLYLGILWLTLPDIDDPRSLLSSQSTVILDRNGIELYRLHGEEDRTFVDGSLIPDHLKKAIIAIEDERYYDRGCIDVRAVGRAVFSFGRGGGASTITRQLARNALHLKSDNLVNRKIKELILGCQLEANYNKEELLDLYLNWIPFGQNAYGVEQASRRYFGISVKDLTLAESAILASLPQRPTYFSPYGPHARTSLAEDVLEGIRLGTVKDERAIPEDAIQGGLLGRTFGTGGTALYLGGRADQVLRNMQNLEFISEKERLAALDQLETVAFKPARENIRAPHFVLWVREQLEEMFKDSEDTGLLEQGGLIIETTLDWELQQAAEKTVNFHKQDMLDRFGANNIALVALDPETKEVLAYVGNTDYSDEVHEGKVDMVRSARQPGSSFKPFVYAAAFQKGYSPATILHDVPTKFGEDEPQNFDGSFWGMMTARRALGASRNIPAVKAFFLAGGEDPILELASKMGAATPLRRKQELILERNGFDYGWPLALGAGETPLMEMVLGYSTFASRGTAKPFSNIRSIKNQNGALLPCSACVNTENPGEEVLDPRIAYQIISVLSDISVRPNEYWQSVLSVPGFETAAKTGTSNKCLERNEKDGSCELRKPDNVWTIGFTPALVAGVWVGNASAASMFDKTDGLTAAAPIWRDFMGSAHKLIEGKPVSFEAPEGIVQPQISELSGELPTECTPIPFRKADVFLSEFAPTMEDPACVELMVDKVTGLLASDSCPVEAQEKRSFYVPQSILADRWPLWQKGVLEWAARQSEFLAAHTGSQLPLPVAPTEKCDVDKTPGRLIKPHVSIEHPGDSGTASYPSFIPRLDMSVGSGVREILYEIDGKRVARVGSGSNLEPPLRVPKSIKESGTHTLRVTLIDTYFNEARDEVHFSFGKDSSGPRIRFIRPESGARVKKGSEIAMEAEADDSEGGIKYVQFYIGDKLLTTKPRSPYRISYTLTDEEGSVLLRVVATDLAGNEGEDSLDIVVLEGGEEELRFDMPLDQPIE